MGEETFVEYRVIWPDDTVLECGRDRDHARRAAKMTAAERDATPRHDPHGHRRLPGLVQRRRVTREPWH